MIRDYGEHLSLGVYAHHLRSSHQIEVCTYYCIRFHHERRNGYFGVTRLPKMVT
jgi:hypothetical protein